MQSEGGVVYQQPSRTGSAVFVNVIQNRSDDETSSSVPNISRGDSFIHRTDPNVAHYLLYASSWRLPHFRKEKLV
jgi:hypothetical protein